MTRTLTQQPNHSLSVWQRSKSYLYPVLILFWLFCIPLALCIYTPWSYQINCHWNERCDRLGSEMTGKSIRELNELFLHQRNELPRPWSRKELHHLIEVRGMYDVVFILCGCITLLLAFDMRQSARSGRFRRYALSSLYLVMGLLLAMLVIAPFFSFFWMEVFHPLLFNNELWRTDPQDVSWYLMPKQFFLWVILFILTGTILLNLLLIRLLPKSPPAESAPQQDNIRQSQ